MGFFRKLLEDNGFIEKEENEEEVSDNSIKEQPQQDTQGTTPAFFPVHGQSANTSHAQTASGNLGPNYGVFDANVEKPDEAFVKFFEDEMGERNPPGLDYFEFRQQYAIMQQKMPHADPRVILQAVVTNFETNDVHAKDLLMSAAFYKGILTDKKNMFLQDSANEKRQLLAKRQNTMTAHERNIAAKRSEAEQLQKRLQEIELEIHDEKTKMDLASTAGNGMIEEFNKAELKLKAACDYMLKAINDDIQVLSSLS